MGMVPVREAWELISSKKTATYLLGSVTLILMLSTFLPSEFTHGEEEMFRLQQEKPLLFQLAVRFGTPTLVRHPAFIGISFFLFLSTLSCTATRLLRWWRMRGHEFEKDRAMNFRAEATSHDLPDVVREGLLQRLRRARWDVHLMDTGGIYAEKGLALGFWGSVTFHMGMIVCFLAPLVTALSAYDAHIYLTEGLEIRYPDTVSYENRAPGPELSGALMEAEDIWGKYSQGWYLLDFGGTMRVNEERKDFRVNGQVSFMGYQFSMAKYGFSPHIVIEDPHGRTPFDSYLNLTPDTERGDLFPLQTDEGHVYDLNIIFFPDFVMEKGLEGRKIGSRSMDPNNPTVLVKFHGPSGGTPLHRGLLLKPGESDWFEGYKVSFPDFRNWASFAVSMEPGLDVFILGITLGIPGLFVRFLSNERRIEFSFDEADGGTRIMVSGYSRYYPAFLEREVGLMAGIMGKETDDTV